MTENSFQKTLKTLSEVLQESAKEKTTGTSEKVITEKRLQELEISEKEIRQGLTRSFGIWSIVAVSMWLIFIVLIILLVGFGYLNYSNSVLITLLTTTTVNVVALSLVIIKGLFSATN